MQSKSDQLAIDLKDQNFTEKDLEKGEEENNETDTAKASNGYHSIMSEGWKSLKSIGNHTLICASAGAAGGLIMNHFLPIPISPYLIASGACGGYGMVAHAQVMDDEFPRRNFPLQACKDFPLQACKAMVSTLCGASTVLIAYGIPYMVGRCP